MGWGSGSRLMTDVMMAMKSGKVPDETRKLVYGILIPAMQNRDWDTEVDCMGVDPVYDNLLRSMFPDWFEDD